MPNSIFSDGHGKVPECVAVLVFAVLSSVQTRQLRRLCKQNEVVLLVGEPSVCLIARLGEFSNLCSYTRMFMPVIRLVKIFRPNTIMPSFLFSSFLKPVLNWANICSRT